MDRKEFRPRLKDLPLEQVALISARAAVRVFPIVTHGIGKTERDQSHALLTARGILTSGVASKLPTPEAMDAANAAAGAVWVAANAPVNAAFAVADAPARAAFTFVPTRADPVNAVFAAARAADAGGAAADAVGADAVDAAVAAADAVDAAVAAADAAFAVGIAAARATDSAANEDTELDLDTLWTRPVWHKPGEPDWLGSALISYDNLLEAGPEWDFWRRWYHGFLNGAHVDWELQRRVALIEEGTWEAGPEAVADRIAKIEKELQDERGLTASQAQDQAELLIEESTQAAVAAGGLNNLIAMAVTAYKREISNALPDALEPLEQLPPILDRIATILSGDLETSEKEKQLITLIQNMAHTISVLNTGLIKAKNEISALNAKSDAGSPKRLFADAFYRKAGEGAAGLITSKVLWGGLISGSVLLLGADADALTDGLSKCFQSVIAPEAPEEIPVAPPLLPLTEA